MLVDDACDEMMRRGVKHRYIRLPIDALLPQS